MNPWIDWVKQLKAISQAGLTYSKDKFDLERFKQLEQISHQMFHHLSEAPIEQINAVFFPETGYPTPKIDLRAAVIKDDKILLVKEREDGCWTMPGGWADVCESASQGVVREVLEESGYVVEHPRLFAVKDRALHDYQPLYPFHIYKMFFICDFVGGEALENIEISEIGFFELNNLPPLSKGRVQPEDIQLAFDHYNQQQTEIYLD